MPAKKEPSERKERLTIKIKKKYIDELRKIEKYNPKLEILIEEFIQNQKDS